MLKLLLGLIYIYIYAAVVEISFRVSSIGDREEEEEEDAFRSAGKNGDGTNGDT